MDVVRDVLVDGEILVVDWRENVDDPRRATEEIARALLGAGLGLQELSPVTPSLEEVFAEITEDAGSSEAV
jgi:hypothetical protein